MPNNVPAPAAPLEYRNFDVEISPGQGSAYPIAVRSDAGEVATTAQLPLEDPAFGAPLQSLGRALRGSRDVGGDAEPLAPQGVAKIAGGALFSAVFNADVRSLYGAARALAGQQDQGLRIRLFVRPPALAVLPWEFLYDAGADDYLCLSRETPVVRYPDVARPIAPPAAGGPLRILAMAAGPNDLPALMAGAEKGRIAAALQNLEAAGQVQVTWLERARATWPELQAALQQGPWHVFHFIGHGSFDTVEQAGYIALVDERTGGTYKLGAADLGLLLGNRRDLRLAVLNSCRGAAGSPESLFAGTAATLIRRGLPAALAMQYPISDAGAIALARGFYGALAARRPVDAALTEARLAIRLSAPGTLEWGTPVLYMRAADGALFGALPKGDGAATQRPGGTARGAPMAVDPAVLRSVLVQRFSLDELRTLGLDIGVDLEDLDGAGKEGKARELIAYLQRREGRAGLDRLVAAVLKIRPGAAADLGG